MLAAACNAGYEIVAISDDASRLDESHADVPILVSENVDAAYDLFISRVLMLFELSLSQMARM